MVLQTESVYAEESQVFLVAVKDWPADKWVLALVDTHMTGHIADT